MIWPPSSAAGFPCETAAGFLVEHRDQSARAPTYRRMSDPACCSAPSLSAGWQSGCGVMPFLLTAAILAGLLIIFSLRTLRRRSRALLLPQPVPLEAADQARRAGLGEAELIVARDQRIVVVHIDTNGRHRIEAPHGR
jgi:hypothetical protein